MDTHQARPVILAHLHERSGLALTLKGIVDGINLNGHALTEDAALLAVNYLDAMQLIEATPDPLGASVRYKITAKGSAVHTSTP